MFNSVSTATYMIGSTVERCLDCGHRSLCQVETGSRFVSGIGQPMQRTRIFATLLAAESVLLQQLQRGRVGFTEILLMRLVAVVIRTVGVIHFHRTDNVCSSGFDWFVGVDC